MPDTPTLMALITVAVLLDAGTTALALRAGYTEANPLMKPLVNRALWRTSLLLWLIGMALAGGVGALVASGRLPYGGPVHWHVFLLLTAASIGKLLAAASNTLLLLTGISLFGVLRRPLGRARSRLLDLLVLAVLLGLPGLMLIDWLFPGFGLDVLPPWHEQAAPSADAHR